MAVTLLLLPFITISLLFPVVPFIINLPPSFILNKAALLDEPLVIVPAPWIVNVTPEFTVIVPVRVTLPERLIVLLELYVVEAILPLLQLTAARQIPYSDSFPKISVAYIGKLNISKIIANIIFNLFIFSNLIFDIKSLLSFVFLHKIT